MTWKNITLFILKLYGFINPSFIVSLQNLSASHLVFWSCCRNCPDKILPVFTFTFLKHVKNNSINYLRKKKFPSEVGIFCFFQSSSCGSMLPNPKTRWWTQCQCPPPMETVTMFLDYHKDFSKLSLIKSLRDWVVMVSGWDSNPGTSG